MNDFARSIKEPIRFFLRSGPDSWLAALLAHAQDGKLGFYSCCCFVGSRTATHALRPAYGTNNAFVESLHCEWRWSSPHHWLPSIAGSADHLKEARKQPGGTEAEIAFRDLGLRYGVNDDALRRRVVIPMIKAEMRRRERASESPTHAGSRSVRNEPVLTC